MRCWKPALVVVAAGLLSAAVHAQEKPVYRCPGNLYTDALSAKEASAKGCKTLEGAPITVIQSQAPRSAAKSANNNPASGPERVTPPEEQKARDADARRILEAELRQAEDALAAQKKEFNNGEPERRGDERNAQKYLDRIKEMKDAITRKEADIASIKRELSKLGASAPAQTPH